jgi:Fe-S-cluster containining protein
MTIAIVDIETQRIINVAGLKLVGSCLRCGTCCRNINCKHIVSDSYDIDGNKIWRCDIYFSRPMGCALFPKPNDFEKIPECGFHYEVDDG